MAAWGADDEVVQEDGGVFGSGDEEVKVGRRGGARVHAPWLRPATVVGRSACGGAGPVANVLRERHSTSGNTEPRQRHNARHSPGKGMAWRSCLV